MWKANSLLRNFARQAKSLVTRTGTQAEKEREQLLTRLKRMGRLDQEASLADVLTISFRDVSERRLQTQVHKKMLANSVKQARQFITHGHITVDNKTITSPSYLVSVQEETQLSFHDRSALVDPEHPERAAKKKEPKAPEAAPEESEAEAKSEAPETNPATEEKKEEQAEQPKEEAAAPKDAEDETAPKEKSEGESAAA